MVYFPRFSQLNWTGKCGRKSRYGSRVLKIWLTIFKKNPQKLNLSKNNLGWFFESHNYVYQWIQSIYLSLYSYLVKKKALITHLNWRGIPNRTKKNAFGFKIFSYNYENHGSKAFVIKYIFRVQSKFRLNLAINSVSFSFFDFTIGWDLKIENRPPLLL